jgi:hypothetical protein
MPNYDPNTKQVILIPPNPTLAPAPAESADLISKLIHILILLVVLTSKFPKNAAMLERLIKAVEKLVKALTRWRWLEIRGKKPRQ